MSTGLGIFLGLALVSSAILYSSTKDRWNWKKISKWIAALSVVIVACCAITFYLLIRKEDPEIEIGKTTELEGVGLNSPLEDARYAFGEPTKTDTCNSSKCDTILIWEKEKEEILVFLLKNQVQEIRVFKTAFGDIPKLYGIDEYSNEMDIERILGKGEWRKTGDPDWRKLSYDSLNVQWFFMNKEIQGVSVYNPRTK